MNARVLASALALGLASSATIGSTAARAQSNEVAAVPRVAIATTSRAASCDRAGLESFVDRYLAAFIADDPTAAPLASNVRFTENGPVLPLGQACGRA